MTRVETGTTAEIAAWYYGAHDRWPDYFPLDELADAWAVAMVFRNGSEEPDTPAARAEWVGMLRAGLLRSLRKGASACTRCDLALYRLYIGAVLDDAAYENDPFAGPGERGVLMAATGADLMIVGEGPRDYEARTGVPLIGMYSLLGSFCARDCGNFEVCYPGDTPFPAAPCRPVSLKKQLAERGEASPEAALEAVRTERAKRKFWPTDMAGRLLDQALMQAGEWRESWNPRLRRYETLPPDKAPRPGTVYLTELTKCRSAEGERPPWKDRRPTKKEIAACHPHLEMQLYVMQPQAILALGNAAVAALTGMPDPKVLSLRGQVAAGPGGVPVVIEVHPRWIGERAEESAKDEHVTALAESIKKARGLITDGPPAPPPPGAAAEPAPEDEASEDPEGALFIASFPQEMADLLDLDTIEGAPPGE